MKGKLLLISTGIFIFPISIAAMFLWPWWCQGSTLKKILTAPFVLPLVGIAYATAGWWNELK